jgi:hypothetical protein
MLKSIISIVAAAILAVGVSANAGEFSGGSYNYSGSSDYVPEGAQILLDAFSGYDPVAAAENAQKLKDALDSVMNVGGTVSGFKAARCEYPVWNPENERLAIFKVRVFTSSEYFSGGSVLDGKVEEVELVFQWNPDTQSLELINQ